MSLLASVSVDGPTTEITGTTTFFRWQYELIGYALIVAMVALFAAGVYSLASKNEISKKYRPAALASTLICWIASAAYILLVVQWFSKWHSSDGLTYAPTPGTIFTGLRYADWTITVPLLTVELLAVCSLSRTQMFRTRVASMTCAFLMIVTGFLGVIAVGENNAGTVELLVWGAISTVFFIPLYPLLLKPVKQTRQMVGTETSLSLRNAAILLLSIWGVYPLVYLIPLIGHSGSTGWATTTQLAFTVADVIAKAGFGALIHKVAKLRTAEDAAEASAQVPEVYPSEVYISGELLSLPSVNNVAGHRYVDERAGESRTSSAATGATARHVER